MTGQAAGRVLTPSLSGGTLTVLDPAGRIEHRIDVAPAAHYTYVVR